MWVATRVELEVTSFRRAFSDWGMPCFFWGLVSGWRFLIAAALRSESYRMG